MTGVGEARPGWPAAVLRIGLHLARPTADVPRPRDPDGRSRLVPEARLELVPSGAGGDAPTGRFWAVPLPYPSATPDAPTRPDLALPLQVADGLRAELGTAAEEPLWVSLVRPYGLLGAMPWERALGAALDRPVLRLPEFLQAPSEEPGLADVGLLLDPPPGTAPVDAERLLRIAADAAVSGSGRTQTRVHVFASVPWAAALGGLDLGRQVSFHRLSHHASAAPRLSAWTGAIASVMGGRSLDVVHFVCGAEIAEARAALVLGMPHALPEGSPSVVAEVEDVCAMLTQLGAWGAAFTPAPQAAATAMRFMADAVAHARPGRVAYVPLEGHAGDGAEPTEAYRFMLSVGAPRPVRLVDAFVYGVPGERAEAPRAPGPRVAGEAAPPGTPMVPPATNLLASLGSAVADHVGRGIEQAPNWASAMQRYVESATLGEVRRASGDVLLARAGTALEAVAKVARDLDASAVIRMLRSMQAVVADGVREVTGKEDPS